MVARRLLGVLGDAFQSSSTEPILKESVDTSQGNLGEFIHSADQNLKIIRKQFTRHVQTLTSQGVTLTIKPVTDSIWSHTLNPQECKTVKTLCLLKKKAQKLRPMFSCIDILSL